MSQFINKLKDILLGVDIEEDDDDMDEDEMEDSIVTRRERPKPELSSFQPSLERSVKQPSLVTHPSSHNNVIDLHKKTSVNVCSPKNIEEARVVIENTKTQVISIVNLDGIDNAMSQRIADFLSGSVDALDGTIRRLSDEMFIIGPYGVNISGGLNEQINQELKSSGITLPWASAAFK